VSLNQILLIGNVGTDPEMRYTPSGTGVTNFRLAVNYRRSASQDGEQPQDETEWFTVTCFNRLADQVNQYVVKGKKVFVDGRLRSSSFVGNDGQTRFRNEVIANRVLFLDRAGEASGGDYPPQAAEGGMRRQQSGRQQQAAHNPEDVEELPW
jgi:single-strand DNA-binding protein